MSKRKSTHEIFLEVTKPKSNQARKALFLDRDGIINIDHGYVSTIDGFEFSEGIFELLEYFRDAGYLLFVITNQSGIGRGYYKESDFHRLTEWMVGEFERENIMIEKVFYCPHTPDAMCHCRKPDIGMIEKAIAEYPLDLKRSWMIGDKSSDIALANNAGIGNSIYIGEKLSYTATLSFTSVYACGQYFKEIKVK